MEGQRRIGVLTPLVGGFYFGSLIAGIHERARQVGYQTLIVQTVGSQHESYKGHLKQPLAWDHVDGWVAINDAVPVEHLHHIKHHGRPLTTVSLVVPELECPAVLPDNRGGMQEAVRHLIAHGHQKIAFVGYLRHDDIRQRYAGYQAALAEAGLLSDERLLFDVDDNMQPGGEMAARHMLAHGLPCTAVVAATDMNAVGLMETLAAAGYRLPEDVAVIGFDDIEAADYLTPPLTSVRQRFDHLGSAAAEQLLAQLEGAPARHEIKYVPTALVLRRSCGCGSGAVLLSQPAAQQQTREWQQTLHQQILELALHPIPLPAGRAPAELWPGGVTITKALQAAVEGELTVSSGAIFDAWSQLIELTLEVDAIEGMNKLLEQSSKQLLAGAQGGSEESVQRFLSQTRVELMRARMGADRQRISALESVIYSNYNMSLTLLADDAGSAKELSWIWSTAASWGCLALWQAAAGAGAPQLCIVGGYNREQAAALPNSSVPAEAFPPVSDLLRLEQERRQDPVILLPLRTAARDWGVLALVSPVDTRFSSGFDALSQWAALLTAALQREDLQDSLVMQQRDLRQAYERERMLALTVREMGCPIIPLMRNVILVPLVGAIDAERAQQLLEGILSGISQQQASTVLVDITGVPVIDTHVASSLVQTTRAASLLGASTVLVGVRPEIAQSIISLGIDLSSISTHPSLASAVEALQRPRNGLPQVAGPNHASTD